MTAIKIMLCKKKLVKKVSFMLLVLWILSIGSFQQCFHLQWACSCPLSLKWLLILWLFLRESRNLEHGRSFFLTLILLKLFTFEPWVTLHCESAMSELNTSLYSPGNAANIVPKLWVFPTKGYGLWIIEGLWVMVCKSPPTKLVDQKGYGISGCMGYLS